MLAWVVAETMNYAEHGKPRTECGVFAMYLDPSLVTNEIVVMGLSAALQNQHRGQESAGFVVSWRGGMGNPFKTMGLYTDLYREYKETVRSEGDIHGNIINVHNRYSTTGSSNIENAAPFKFDDEKLGYFSLALNGNITNAKLIRDGLESDGIEFKSTTDTEVVGKLIETSPGEDMVEKIGVAAKLLTGAFNLTITTCDTLYAVRDRYGFHPLYRGEFKYGGHTNYAISSETNALGQLYCNTIEEVLPGEIVKINRDSVEINSFADPEPAFCGLESAYILRPDGHYLNTQVHRFRVHHGEMLAEFQPLPEDIDLISYVPESAWSVCEGFAKKTSELLGRDISIVRLALKGRYGTINGTVRGFIDNNEAERQHVANSNYFPFDDCIGKRVGLVDDSIFAGNTLKGFVHTIKNEVGLLKDSGAMSVHVRVAFPMTRFSCPYGVDVDVNKRRLLANAHNSDLDAMCKEIGADSLGFLTPEQYTKGIADVAGYNVGMCMACTTGIYPEPVSGFSKFIMEQDIK